MVEVSRVEIVFANPLTVMEVEQPALGAAFISITFDRFIITAKGNVMYTLPADHTVLMQISYVDASGNPATVDSEVQWTSSDEALLTLEVDPGDGKVCRAMPVGGVGQVQVSATCDADIGEGVRELITLCDIEIVGGEAVTGSIQPLGEPEPKAPHVAPRKGA